MTDLEASQALKFIIDEPADDDFFKTHVPIARSIALAVFRNRKLRVIGLLGRWGSGKSTIVKEFERQLISLSNKYIVFTYDAWLHQNDPIRRSFLESIVHFLTLNSVVSSDTWNDRLQKLSGSLEIIDKKETPTVTAEAKRFFFAGLIFSLGAFLAKDTFKDALKENHVEVSLWGFRLALILMAAPVAFVLSRYIIAKIKGLKVSLLPNILLNKDISHTNVVTQKPAEPSSIEFGEAFRDLMKETASKGRLPIIVIDNIDRLSDDEAMQIWASMRSFFLSSNDDNALDTEAYHPIVILPIDGQAISQMFSVGSDDTRSSVSLASSFINKTFDVTFNVPNPVMSDWKLYLRHNMEIALGSQFSELRFHKTKYYMDRWFTTTNIPITPREITKSLNRIIALLLQWYGDTISFDSIAYFSINRSAVDGDIQSAVSDNSNPLAADNPNWQRELAALHFGVPVNHAAQVLMADPLRKALLDGDLAGFSQYQTIAGFGGTFESITEDLPINDLGAQSKLATIMNAVAALEVYDAVNEVWYVRSWRNLIQAFIRIDRFYPAPKMDLYISSMSTHINTDDINAFVKAIERLIDFTISNDKSTPQNVQEAAVLGDLAISLAETHAVALPIFDLTGSASDYLTRLSLMGNSTRSRIRTRTSATHKDLIIDLIARVTDEKLSPTVPDLVKILTSSHSDLMIKGKLNEVDSVIATAENAARSSAGETKIFRSALATLRTINPLTDTSRSAFGRLVDDGTILARLPSLATQDDEIAISLSVGALVWRELAVRSPIGSNWSDFFKKYPNIEFSINSFVDDLCTEKEAPLDKIAAIHEKDGNSRQLATLLFEGRIKRGSLGPLYPQKMLNSFRRYSRVVDYRYKDKLASLLASNYEAFVDSIDNLDWSENLFEAAERLKRAGGEPSIKFNDQLLKKLNDTSREEWKKAVLEGTEPYKVSTKILDRNDIRFGPTSPLATALLEASQSGTALTTAAVTRWFELSRLLSPHSRREASDNLFKNTLHTSPQFKLDLLNLGGPSFIKDISLFKGNPSLFQGIVFPLLAIKKGRVWLHHKRHDLKAVISALDVVARQDIESKLSTLSNSTNAERKSWGDRALKDWGFNLGKPE